MAEMIISCQLFEAYLLCPLKCWLRSRAEPVTGNKYAEWTQAYKEAYQKGTLREKLFGAGRARLAAPHPAVQYRPGVTARAAE